MAKRSVVLKAGAVALGLIGVVLWLALAPASGPRTGTGDASRDRPDTASGGSSSSGSSTGSSSAIRLGGSVLGRTVRGESSTPVAATFRVEGLDGPAREASGDADGTFFIPDLPREKELELQVSAPGTAMLRIPIRIPATGPLDLGDLELGAAVSVDVLVMDAAGVPVKGAMVETYKSTPWVPGTDWARVQLAVAVPGSPASSGTTAADGRARLTGAPPGGYFLVVRAHGFARFARAIHLRAGAARTPERVILLPSITLTGRVLGPGDAPMAGVTVWADPGNLWNAPPVSRVQSVSDEKGAYRLEGMSAGTFTLKARTSSNVLYSLPSIDLPALAEFDIRLVGTGTLRGLVTDAITSSPVAGADVTLTAYNQETGAQTMAVATSDTEGKVVITGIPRSTWANSSVRAEGYVAGALELGSSPLIEDGGVLEGTARLRKGVMLSGRVADESGKPVAGATVECRQWDARLGVIHPGRAITAADGTYSVENVPTGAVLLRVSATGFHQPDYPANEWQELQQGTSAPTCTVHVAAGAPAVKDLALQTSAGVSGAVVGTDGAPREGITLVVISRKGKGGGGSGAPSDAQGRFHLTSVAPGEELVVQARGPDGLYGESDPFALVSGGSATDIRITVNPGGTVTGRVSREDGGALAGAVVKHFVGKIDPSQPWNMGWQRRQAVTHPVAPDGTFRIEGLAAGEYTLFAGAPDAGPAPDTVVKLEKSETRDGIDLELPRERILSGRALDAEGKGLAGAEVRLLLIPKGGDADSPVMNFNPGSSSVAAVSMADGRFRVGGLGPGKYSVTVGAAGLQDARETVDLSREGAEIEVTLKSGLVIAGIVTDSDGGAPIAGVAVQAHPQIYTGGVWRNYQAKSDATGRFVIKGVPEGQYAVNVGNSYGQEPSSWIPESRNGVAAGTEDLSFVLKRGLSIAGSIQKADGTPVTGMLMVTAVPRGNDGNLDHSRQRFAQSRTDGTFEVSGLEAATYDLSINQQQFGGSGSPYAPTRVEGVVAGSRDVVVQVRTGVALTGRVVDPDGAPSKVHGQLMVRVSGSDAVVGHAQSGPNGAFSFAALDPGNTYDIEATNFQGSAGGSVRGVRPGAGEVVLRLEKGGSISGRVATSQGAAVEAGTPVMAAAKVATGANSGQAPGSHAWAQTDAEGKFTLSGLGDFEFTITVGGGTSAYVNVTSQETWRIGATDVVINVELGVEITGRIVDADGKPTQPQWIMAVPKGEGGNASYVQPGADGSFRLRGLRAGTYTMSAFTEGGQVQLGEQEAPASGVELRMK